MNYLRICLTEEFERCWDHLKKSKRDKYIAKRFIRLINCAREYNEVAISEWKEKIDLSKYECFFDENEAITQILVTELQIIAVKIWEYGRLNDFWELEELLSIVVGRWINTNNIDEQFATLYRNCIRTILLGFHNANITEFDTLYDEFLLILEKADNLGIDTSTMRDVLSKIKEDIYQKHDVKTN